MKIVQPPPWAVAAELAARVAAGQAGVMAHLLLEHSPISFLGAVDVSPERARNA